MRCCEHAIHFVTEAVKAGPYRFVTKEVSMKANQKQCGGV
jgi:hypothetical protein